MGIPSNEEEHSTQELGGDTHPERNAGVLSVQERSKEVK